MIKKLTVLTATIGFFLLALALNPLSASACAPGDKAQVLWKGSWYPATVLQSRGNKCYIHYDGYNSSWDEWVGPSRIRVSGGAPGVSKILNVGGSLYNVGDAVSVKWKGSWWPAHVVQAGNNKWYIHYDGYSNSWDEWVGPGRIRPR